MSSDNFLCASSVLNSIEMEYDSSRALNEELIAKFFEELLKLENGSEAVKQFTWLFGIGEEKRHVVESKECLKVFLIDFKHCRKYLNNFLTNQD